MSPDSDFSVCYVRPESSQLFFLFTGNAEQLMFHPMDFIRKTGIGGRNIVILRDPFQACYRKGVAKEYDSLDGLVRWQKEQLAGRFSHVREVFCVGTSGGGGPAIFTGHHLGAKAVWSLAGRLPLPPVVKAQQDAFEATARRVLGHPGSGMMTPEERSKVAKALDSPEGRDLRWELGENPDTVLDRGFLDQLVGLLRDRPGATHYHFYYAVTNSLDELTAEAFRGCPGARLHPITSISLPRDSALLANPDHLIVLILDRMGKLSSVFSEYL